MLLPTDNEDDMQAPTVEIASVPQFAKSLLNTLQNWADSMQTRVPGYRGRIVAVNHTKKEGGMNLGMGSTVVSALATRGQHAGKATDGFDFDNHRWLRFRSFLQTLEEIVKPAGPKLTQARGQVYRCDVGFGLKPWLIVSNNARNRHTADVLAIGLTTTVRQLPTCVPLSSGDPLTGYANVDNIETLGKDELGDHLGALTPEIMTRVNRALAIALASPTDDRAHVTGS